MQKARAGGSRPSQSVDWHLAQSGGFRIQCVRPYRRFRGIEIPWDDAVELADVTEEVTKASRSRKVVKLAAGHFGSPLEVYVKRYNFKTWYGPYLRLARPSRAREEFELGWALMDAGLKTPRPVWLAEQLGPLPRYSLLATEAIPAVENVLQRWARLKREEDRRELLLALGRFLRRMHDQGFYHDDCKAGHVLVHVNAPSAPAEFYIIDLLGGQLMGNVNRMNRAKNLYQMLRHFLPRQGSQGFHLQHREALLEAYGGSPREAAHWSRWVKGVGHYKGRRL